MISLSGLSAVPGAYNAAQADQFRLDAAARQQQAQQVIGKVLQAIAMRQQAPMGGNPPVQEGSAPAPALTSMQGRFADAFAGTPNARPQDTPAAPAAPAQPQVNLPSTAGIAPGSLTWDRVVNAIAQKNPGIKPDVLAEAVSQFEPLMTRDSAEKWKQVQAQQVAQTNKRLAASANKQARAPTGYRWNATGDLEAIPGGPAANGGAGKPPTQQALRNQQLYSVAKPEAERLLGPNGTFDALTSAWNQGANAAPFGIGNAAKSPEYQAAANSLKTIVASYLYSVSGATANPGEVATQVDILMPKFGDKPEAIAQKRTRIQQMVDSIGQAGGVAPEAAQAPAQAPAQEDSGAIEPGAMAAGPDGQPMRFRGGDSADPQNWEPVY